MGAVQSRPPLFALYNSEFAKYLKYAEQETVMATDVPTHVGQVCPAPPGPLRRR
jgi:hypothetical protein